MPKQINKTALCKEWVHSSEEDTDDETVFRPADYAFPLVRRPRASFQLAPDGNLMTATGSPTDRLDETRGTWKLANNEITFYKDAKPVDKKQVKSVGADKLVLKK